MSELSAIGPVSVMREAARGIFDDVDGYVWSATYVAIAYNLNELRAGASDLDGTDAAVLVHVVTHGNVGGATPEIQVVGTWQPASASKVLRMRALAESDMLEDGTPWIYEIQEVYVIELGDNPLSGF